ncbi:MAG: hypothetical protein PQJ61_01575 [Spirochaetales bacterium]|uniref:Uncharacterized protein n=1 Tax=Candidatus Thalassospirochaeta sargassi TaxID=3119039 RepID=A0AAJ1IA74_9SPIO|nr:hypothetical protein [Spirochaetales bacterium]
MDKRLYGIVEYILNIADPDDLEVISQALEKRINDHRSAPVLGLNPAKLAAQSTDSINEQLEGSKQMVSRMAADFAANIIRENAPELSEAQVQELLADFMPESAGGRGRQAEKHERSGDSLPAGMIIQMVQQFVEYSEGAMSPAEQIQMETEVPGWKDRYWRSFPGQIQKLISLYLNGDIDRSRFDAHVYEVLGL